MNVLIVAATYHEVKPFLRHYQQMEVQRIYKFKTSENNISVLITGVGMIATTFELSQYLFENNHFDLVINVGIAGAFHPKLMIGDTVLIHEDCFSEMGAESPNGFIPIGDLGLGFKNNIINNTIINNEFLEKLPLCKAITVNKVHGLTASIVETEILFSADIESMEGAAFAYVCQELKLDYIQMRSISNRVEERNKENWNIPLAIKNINESLSQLIHSL